jgi:hypothetical protein
MCLVGLGMEMDLHHYPLKPLINKDNDLATYNNLKAMIGVISF